MDQLELLASPSNLIEQVHDRLVDAIAEGTLTPATHLTQAELAA